MGVAGLILSLLFAARAGAEAPPQTRQSQAEARQAYLKLIDRPRVDPQVEEKEMEAPGEGLRMWRIAYWTEAGQRVPAIVVKPASAKEGQRLPVVIALHGTSSKKESNLTLLKKLAAKGMIGVAPDGRYHGERKTGEGTAEYFAQIAKAYADNATDSGPGKAHPWLFDTTWDVMRLIDVMGARADVDPKKVGLIGFSKGGMETYLTAAADERVAVAIPCIGVQTFLWGLENDQWQARVGTVSGGWKAAMTADNIPKPTAADARRFFDRVIPGIYGPLDCPQALPRIAPRPLMVINSDQDKNTPLPGVLIAGEAAKKAYAAAGVPERFELIVQEKTGHSVKPESLNKAVEWFEKWLK